MERHIEGGKPNQAGAEEKPTGQNYLFVIGVDDYSNFSELNNAVEDAKAFTDTVLRKYMFYDPRVVEGAADEYDTNTGEYLSSRTKCLFNATRENIKKNINLLSREIGENDNVLIYFAGHGEKKATGFYFIPSDGLKEDEDSWIDVKKMAVNLTIRQNPDKTTVKICKNLLIFLDCCYSASSLSGLSNSTGNDEISRYVIASAFEKATDGQIRQGTPFRKAVCEVLNENMQNEYCIEESTLSAAFDRWMKMDTIANPQKIVSGYLPLDHGNGLGKFVFELREKNIPPIDKICDSFIRYLNFESERGQFKGQIKNRGHKLGFICLHEDKYHLALMKKAIRNAMMTYFKDFSVSLNDITVSDRNLSDGGVWKELRRYKHEIREGGLSDSGNILEEEKNEIVNWLFNQAHSDTKSPGILVVNIALETKNKLVLPSILHFCEEIPAIYERIKDRSGSNNYLIILLTEEKKDEHVLLVGFREKTKLPEQIGLVQSISAKGIEESEVIDWLDNAQNIIKLDSFKQVKSEALYSHVLQLALSEQKIKVEQEGNPKGIPVYYFIEKSCEYIFKDAYASKINDIKRMLYED